MECINLDGDNTQIVQNIGARICAHCKMQLSCRLATFSVNNSIVIRLDFSSRICKQN